MLLKLIYHFLALSSHFSSFRFKQKDRIRYVFQITFYFELYMKIWYVLFSDKFWKKRETLRVVFEQVAQVEQSQNNATKTYRLILSLNGNFYVPKDAGVSYLQFAGLCRANRCGINKTQERTGGWPRSAFLFRFRWNSFKYWWTRIICLP